VVFIPEQADNSNVAISANNNIRFKRVILSIQLVIVVYGSYYVFITATMQTASEFVKKKGGASPSF